MKALDIIEYARINKGATFKDYAMYVAKMNGYTYYEDKMPRMVKNSLLNRLKTLLKRLLNRLF